jgi:hypothetical protein
LSARLIAEKALRASQKDVTGRPDGRASDLRQRTSGSALMIQEEKQRAVAMQDVVISQRVEVTVLLKLPASLPSAGPRSTRVTS